MLPDGAKMGLLISSAPKELHKHLCMNANDLKTYDQVKTTVNNYIGSHGPLDIVYTAQSSRDHSRWGGEPMEVDKLGK